MVHSSSRFALWLLLATSSLIMSPGLGFAEERRGVKMPDVELALSKPEIRQLIQYPVPAGLKLLSQDKITVHEDSNGDGRYDKHKTCLDGQTTVIERGDIEEMSAIPRSIMPESILKDYSDQQIRDLFACLRSTQHLQAGRR